jgi:citrate lyase beta subunit/acyl dehydratase
MAGKFFEDLEVGLTFEHALGRTFTEMDNVLFTSLTMNTQPLHLNEDFSAKTQFGRRIVNGIFTLGVAVGITVPDLTEGTLVGNLGYENVKHPRPMFHGDTLYVNTEVLSRRESRSRPEQGIVCFRHVGRNQHGEIVIEFERTALILKQPTRSEEQPLKTPDLRPERSMATGRAVSNLQAPVSTPSAARPRRALLFMPGDSLRKIRKAAQLDVDSIVMDLEDGVALNRKDEARRTVVEALQTLDFGRTERLIRLNPPETDLFTADLQATVGARPDGYVVPKVEAPAQVKILSRKLAEAEHEQGWPPGSIRLVVLIETARGVVHAGEIARADERIQALAFGGEDLVGDIGTRRTRDGWEVFYARSAVITAAKAYGRQAIDTVFVALNDPEGLEADCQLARTLGFDGKMAIHPGQVEVMNRIFAPSAEEIGQARRLLEAHAARQAAGTGAFELDGKMVDMPMVRAAEALLVRARSGGLVSD